MWISYIHHPELLHYWHTYDPKRPGAIIQSLCKRYAIQSGGNKDDKVSKCPLCEKQLAKLISKELRGK